MKKHKYFRIKKGYVRIGKRAYTNIVYRDKAITINLSAPWLLKLFGWNTKVIYLSK